eukprot:Lithocolla_globosa_v1_NODE_2475_length_1987_cov_7.271222.p2 type:complete len:166 gc:universal NODE_2475_length_1987_cov_7.271222:1874-1377(-)
MDDFAIGRDLVLANVNLQETAERQKLEVEALKAIFMEDFKEITSAWKVHKPHFVINVRPPDVDECHVSLGLEIRFPEKYPHVVPGIKVVKEKGLSQKKRKALYRQLEEEAATLLGEEMVYLLVETCKAYLSENNQPTLSFYDEMMSRNQNKKSKKLKRKLRRRKK